MGKWVLLTDWQMKPKCTQKGQQGSYMAMVLLRNKPKLDNINVVTWKTFYNSNESIYVCFLF